MKSLLTAVRTLTVVPLPMEESFTGADALVWFPAVGGGLGGLLYGVAAGGNVIVSTWGTSWPQGVALMVLVVQFLLTGVLHLDGMADWADARAGRNRNQRLEIMADSKVGTFGMVAIVLSLLVRYAAVSQLVAAGTVVWLIPVLMTARAGQVHLCVRWSTAREGGMGAGFIDGARFMHWMVVMGITMLVLGGGFGAAGLMVGGTGLLVSEGFGFWNASQLDGVTGDVLGACNEWVEVVLLAGLAAVPDLLSDTIPVLNWLFG